MESCKHRHLVLLPNEGRRLRCRHCHLTIKEDELDTGYCPECFERCGKRHEDFEVVETASDQKIRYRCEACHAIIEYVALEI
jgi:phage terminase large subunit GpA-like protein